MASRSAMACWAAACSCDTPLAEPGGGPFGIVGQPALLCADLLSDLGFAEEPRREAFGLIRLLDIGVCGLSDTCPAAVSSTVRKWMVTLTRCGGGAQAWLARPAASCVTQLAQLSTATRRIGRSAPSASSRSRSSVAASAASQDGLVAAERLA